MPRYAEFQVIINIVILSSHKFAHDICSSAQVYEPGLPVVSFRFSDEYRAQNPDVQQKWVQTLLRAKGWIVPNYELAPDLQNIEILRVVVRETVSAVMVDRLVADIVSAPSFSS